MELKALLGRHPVDVGPHGREDLAAIFKSLTGKGGNSATSETPLEPKGEKLKIPRGTDLLKELLSRNGA